MESEFQPPPSELNAHNEGPKLDLEKEPDYFQCGICSQHFLLRSELILHSKEGHSHHHHHHVSNNSYENSTNVKDPGEPVESPQFDEKLQDSVDTKLIPNPPESGSSCTKYSHMCLTCYQVFDYRIQLNCHMKVHKDSPKISPELSEKEIKSTDEPNPAKILATEDPKRNIPKKASSKSLIRTNKSTKSKKKCETRFYPCPNSGCSFTSRWSQSVYNHKKYCRHKQSPILHFPSHQSTTESPKNVFVSSIIKSGSPVQFLECKSQSSIRKTPKSQSPNNSSSKQPLEATPKKSTSSTRKRVSYKNSEKFYLCPNPSCNFRSRWPSSRWQHKKKCLQKRQPSPLKVIKKSRQHVPKKSDKLADNKFCKVVAKKSDKLVDKEPNKLVDKEPNKLVDKEPNKLVDKEPNKLVDKKPNKLVDKQPNKLLAKKSGKLIAKKSPKLIDKKEDLPRLVLNSEKNQLECSICGFCPTKFHNFNQHKATHLKYKPYACDYPGCGFKSRWEGNLRAHMWRRKHESGSKPERNLREECPSNVKILPPKIVSKSKEQKPKLSRSTNAREISTKSSSLLIEESSNSIKECSATEAFPAPIQESSVHIEESSVHIEETSGHIEETSGHIEKLSGHIEELSTPTEDPPNLVDDRKMAPRWSIENIQKLDEQKIVAQSDPHDYSCRIPDCTFESLSASSLRTHYHNMHPTFPLPSICHTSRLRNRSKTEIISSPHSNHDDQDLKEMEPSPSSSSKKQSKMLKQLFSCPMANCTFTTRWQIDIPKHFDRLHSSPGESIWRSNKLMIKQEQQISETFQDNVHSPGPTDQTSAQENQSVSLSKFETFQVECEPVRDVKIPSQNEKSPSPPTLFKESYQEFPPAAEVKVNVKVPRSEVKSQVKRSTTKKVQVEAKKSSTKVKVKAKRSLIKASKPRKSNHQHLSQVVIDSSESIGSKNRFKCPDCNYRSYTRWHIKRHMVTHGEDRPYPCPGCSMTFRNIGHLRIHQSKFPRCDLARRRRVAADQRIQSSTTPSVKPPRKEVRNSSTAPVKTCARQQKPEPGPDGPKNDCVFCTYLSKLSKFLQRHMRKCPGCHKAVDHADVIVRNKKTEVVQDGGSSNVSSAFACTLCEFIGDSEVAALEHSREHKTVLVSLNRVQS